MKIKESLVIDGTDETGAWSGASRKAPYCIFDPNKQDIVAGPFKTRRAAQKMLAGPRKNFKLNF